MHDGIVIGGPAHGETHDPARHGPVLVVPTPTRVPTRYSDYVAKADFASVVHDRVEYRLHDFHSTDGAERIRIRVWLPDHVKPDKAFSYLIETALRAPK